MKKFIVYLFFLNLSCGLFAQNANYEQAEKPSQIGSLGIVIN